MTMNDCWYHDSAADVSILLHFLLVLFDANLSSSLGFAPNPAAGATSHVERTEHLHPSPLSIFAGREQSMTGGDHK